MKQPDQTFDRANQYIVLADGRKLGFAEYGKPSGFPVIALHGSPGSRLWFENDDPVSHELDIRFIATDRPGYGLSDTQKNRSILDYTHDVKQLTEHLGLYQFSVLGISGGGVYAAAMAYHHPGEIYKTAIVSSINQFKNGKPPKGMCKPNRLSFFLAKNLPWLLKVSFNQQKKLIENQPDLYVKSIKNNLDHLCESDQVVSRKEETATWMLMNMKEAFRNNATEVVNEMALLSKNWGFSYNEIKGNLEFWHGTADTLAPAAAIQELEAHLPNSNFHFLEKKGHFLDDDPEIWKAILQSVKIENS